MHAERTHPSDVQLSIDLITELMEDQVQEVLTTFNRWQDMRRNGRVEAIGSCIQLQELKDLENGLLEHAETKALVEAMTRRALIADKIRVEELKQLITSRQQNLNPL